MVQIKTYYEGELRCRAIHMPSESVIHTDAPKDNKGKGMAFSPTDLLAASLGLCYLTTMAISAEERGIDMRGTSCVIEKYMSTDKPRRVKKLKAEISFNQGIPLDKRGLLEAVAVNCPVAKSLHPDIEIDLKLHFPDGQDFEEHIGG